VGDVTFTVGTATEEDAAALATLRQEVAEHLTRQFGKGHWSSYGTVKGVIHSLRTSRILIARRGPEIVATLRLVTKKPWSIDTRHFTPVKRPLYLLDMAVSPALQRHGVGRELLDAATPVARAWPADAIRLDAYDAPAGAGGFYERCGYHEVGRAVYRRTPLIYYELVL
jgi:GNAT superfamily N-acetyltransferase